MGWEDVTYNNMTFAADGYLLARVQKFIVMYLQGMNHPIWFEEILIDLDADALSPYSADFFHEEEVDFSEERKSYMLIMFNMVVEKMESLNCHDFYVYLKNKGLPKENSLEISDMELDEMDKDPVFFENLYKNQYLRIIRNVRDMMNGTFKPEEF